MYVNVYEIDREYGGPEEGGWWYDSGRVIESHPVHSKIAEEQLTEALANRYPNTHTVGNVLYSGGDYRVCVERSPGKDYPEYAPHYE